MLKCDKCDFQAENLTEFNVHLSVKHPVKSTKGQHKCAKCRANFEKQIDLENHIASAHEGRKQYTCNKWSATFENHTPLINHIASVHEGKKQHECKNCTFEIIF